MCRWAAYTGQQVAPATVLLANSNSLIEQSRGACMGTKLNVDGHGLAWWAKHTPAPGVYKSERPLHSDGNMMSLCNTIKANMFFGHVRAGTGSAPSRENSHPFTYKRWAFMHNGWIRRWPRLAKALRSQVRDDFYAPTMRGTTDSETMFGLLLSHGLMDSPVQAIKNMIQAVEATAASASVTAPLQMTMAVGDGKNLFVARYASEGIPKAHSLFYARCPSKALRESGLNDDKLPDRGIIVASEPLVLDEKNRRYWHEIRRGSIYSFLASGKVKVQTI